ncbi:MAG: uracil-DNA glycosylase family protein [Bacteroidota bacterium]|jgi:restriction system protein
MSKEEKIRELKTLGRLRQSKKYKNYNNISDYPRGEEYDTQFVSPYTKSAQNVNSHIAFVLQDWSSNESLNNPFNPKMAELGYDPSTPTNTNLIKLLRQVYGLDLHEVFITNLFPYIKKGSMSARIPQKDLDKAFEEFCKSQINIVRPKLVVCLGKQVYHTFFKNNSQKGRYSVGHYFIPEGYSYTAYYQCHPTNRGVNSRGGLKNVMKDWRKMKKMFPNS